jgi:hypothetical protein
MSNENLETLNIALQDVDAPSFFLWKWTKEDYDKLIRFTIDEVSITFRFTLDSLYKDNKKLPERQMPMHGLFVFTIKNPPPEFLEGLKNPDGKNAEEAAQKIFNLYEKALNKVTLYGRWVTKLTSITDGIRTYYDDMFFGRGILPRKHVYWRLNNQEWKPFEIKPKKKRGINPIFKSKNLLTPKKWERINKFAVSNKELGREIEELVRIKSKVDWGTKRIPTIEIAALIEVIIRNKVQILLEKHGQSRRKIDNVNDETSLSVFLNVVLPLILSKTEMKKHKKYIDALDLLRKTRNDIMHRNISENEINLETVKKGVEAAIKITQLLNVKIN